VINTVHEIKARKQIILLTSLSEEGIKIARLAGNRCLDEKIIKAKKKSLKETGLLVPAIIVEASLALEEGLEVVDFETGEVVTEENADEYVVLVDANHRYKAHLDLVKSDENYKKDFAFMFPLQIINVSKMLSEINVATNPWKTGDYARGAALALKEELPLLTAINSLIANGYSLQSACKWLTFANQVTKSVITRAMNGVISNQLREDSGIERGIKLLNAAKNSFNEDFLKTRTIPDWVISRHNEFEGNKAEFISRMCLFLSNIDKKIASEIEKIKGIKGGDTKESIINKKLTEMWEALDQTSNDSQSAKVQY